MLNRNSPVPNRRPLQLTPYKLKCDKEPLSGRIGPPDFHPQTPNCPEETLTREYLQTGYKDTVEGIEEAREITLTQFATFSRPIVQKCKEGLKKRLKAINESRAQKRKAGQVYGVPLSGQLLTRPGVYPEQRPYGEESRKRWIEGLSQPHKRLRSLADHVPHGFKRNTLLDVLIHHNVPLLRATWFVKVNILNQSKSDKTHSNRTEQWTKIFIENLKCLLDDFLSNVQNREQSSQQALSAASSGEGHLVHSHWWYMVRLLQWHFSEGLLLPAPILEWVFSQLQEKDSVEALELLLPIVVNVIEKLALSQHYVAMFFDIAMRQIKTLNSGAADKDVPYEYSRKRSQLSSTLSEMLRYLILSVPDTFVAADAFTPDIFDVKKSFIKMPENFGHIVSSLHRRVVSLSKVASPNPDGYGLAKVIEKVDKSLMQGDVKGAYSCLFEELSGTIMEERWIKEVNPCLWSSMKWIGTVSMSTICAVFFLCEWATCDHRDFRGLSPHGVKFTGRKDLSRVYFSVSVLKYRRQFRQKQAKATSSTDLMESPGPLHDIISCWLDQNDSRTVEGFKALQVFILELISCGIFHPHAYVRQLMISGIMDGDRRRRNHYRILKQLPGSYLLDVLKDAKFEASMLHETVYIYSNERRLLLQGIPQGIETASSALSHKVKNQLPGSKELPKKDNSSIYLKLTRAKDPVSELKNSIMVLLHISKLQSNDLQGVERHLKRNIVRMDGADVAKMQKLNDERGSPLSGNLSYTPDDDESWWARKGSKFAEKENSKSEPMTHKSTKHASRGRRKTQSLAQLAAARIEGSQGASTSHVCENKVFCISHKSASDVDISRSTEGIRTRVSHLRDVGRALKQLRLLEKKSVIIWLSSLMKLLIEGNEKSGGGPFSPSVEEGALRWKLREEELSFVLYLFDVSCDWLSSARFLLWLSPRVVGGSTLSALAGRNSMILPKHKDNQVVDIGDVFFWSSLQRYGGVLAAAELLPEALTAAIQGATSVFTSNGRSFGSSALNFIRKILKKYGQVPGVATWEKNLRTTCDPRLLSEIESARSSDSDLGFSSGMDDVDDYLRQKMAGNGRTSRVGMGMKETIHRHVEEALLFSHGRESKNPRGAATEKWDDDAYVSHKIVLGLMEIIRQNGGEVDPFLISSAISAIVGNVGSIIVNTNYQNLCVPENSLSYLQRVVRIHLSCLCLLKEALGDRVNRIFELTIASESSSIISWVYSPGKFPPRGQFQQSTETHDTINSNNPGAEVSNSGVLAARAVRAAAAVSALVIGALVNGVSTLERMIAVFRLKEGLDIQQFIRSSRTSSNGISRSNNSSKIFKLDHCIEKEYVHWFRVLIGNFCTVFDGLIAEIVDESYICAFSRIQRMVPPTVIFPPAYSIFALIVWRPYVLANGNPTREEAQLFPSLASAIEDAIKHHPFRDSFFRDTRILYDLLASDSGDSEFAAIFDLHGQDKHLKTRACLPLRARLFLNAIVDCKLPSWTSGQQGEQRPLESETKLLDELVHLLDTLHPAKFHWQWVMVRLLLNEQVLIEKMETRGMSLSEAIRSLYPNTENLTSSENESSFTEIVLTRLLVRPDAASLYSDILRLLGRSLEEKLLVLVKWFLGGNDVLLGRKSIGQRLLTFAQPKGVSTKVKLSRPWGWSNYDFDDKRKAEVSALEEGEVVDEVAEVNKQGLSNYPGQLSDVDFVTEQALAELVLPCIDRSSGESRDTFASELIKQMCLVDQYINSLLSNSLLENSSGKGGNRKSIQGGSPGMGRRPSGNTDSAPPSVPALRASLWLRLQFILRSLPNIYTDRDPSTRSMKHMLASVLLHLMGARVVYEDADVAFFPATRTVKRQTELTADPVPVTSLDCSGDSLFNMFLSVFHGLLSGCKPSWLKLGSSSKPASKIAREFSTVDRDFAENLQAELDQMHLPMSIRKRIQAAIPTLPSPLSLSISCHPPTLSPTLLSTFHATASLSPNPGAIPRASLSSRLPLSSNSRSKPLAALEPDLEVDPWTLLEDGTGSSSASVNGSADVGGGGDASNLKACSWLKGAVRVRRSDLTYIGVRDDDS